jgi:predicted ArsR family transcriptional regulator
LQIFLCKNKGVGYNYEVNTRQAIISHLQERPYAYAEELSQVLSRTRANIQYHLQRLETDGLIIPVCVSSPKVDRGRPRTYYALSVEEKPDNLAALADVLLKTYLDAKPDQAIDPVKINILAQAILPPKPPVSGSAARLNRLIKDLTARGYQARWEARAGGPEITFRNCPYAALIDQHPGLCQMDLRMLQNNTGIAFRQTHQIHLTTTPACRFIIESANASKTG